MAIMSEQNQQEILLIVMTAMISHTVLMIMLRLTVLSDDSVGSSPTPMTQSAQSPLSSESDSSSDIEAAVPITPIVTAPMIIYKKWLELNKHCDLLHLVTCCSLHYVDEAK